MARLGGAPRVGSREYRAQVKQQSTSPKLERALQPVRQALKTPPARPKPSGALPIDHQHGGGRIAGTNLVQQSREGPGLGPDRVARLRDQKRLLGVALNPRQAPSHRLSALRELRLRHQVPITNRDYLDAVTPGRAVHSQSQLHRYRGNLAFRGPAADVNNARSIHFDPLGLLMKLSRASMAARGEGINPPPPLFGGTTKNLKQAGVVDPQQVAGAVVGLSDKAATSLLALINKVPGSSQYGAIQSPAAKSAKQFGQNAARDVIDLPAQTLASVYLTAADPKSLVTSTKDTLQHPVRSFLQHPVSTALIFRGGEAALSRGLGAAGRATRALPQTYERAPLKLVGNTQLPRSYSKGGIEQLAQLARDERARRKQGLAKGEPIQASNLQAFGFTGHGGARGRRLDIARGSNEAMRREARAQGYGELYRRGVAPRSTSPASYGMLHHGADLVPLISEGVVKTGSEHRPLSSKTVEADLLAERQRIVHAHEHQNLDPAQLADSQHNLDIVDRLLADKHFLAHPEQAIKAAAVYASKNGTHEQVRAFFQDLNPRQARRRVLLPVALREQGLEPVMENGKVVRFEKGGVPVHDKQILQDFVEAGGDPAMLAYVPQSPDFKGPQNFAQSRFGRPGKEARKFTGAVTKSAAYQRDYEVLAQQLSKAAVKVERHRATNSLLNQYGVGPEGGGFFENVDEGSRMARAIRSQGGEDYVPVVAARKEAIDTFGGMLDPAHLEHNLRPATEGDRNNVLLFPAHELQRINHHEWVAMRVPIMRQLQAFSSRFRHVVLPTSPRWPVGNMVEMELRIALHDPTLGLASVPRGRAFERQIAALPEGTRTVGELRAHAAAGMFGSQSRLDIHREAEHVLTRSAQTIRNAGLGPGHVVGPKGVVDAWGKYRDGVFWLNERAESGIYFSALDRYARSQLKVFSKDWFKAMSGQGKALGEVAKLFHDPNGKIDYNRLNDVANMVDEMRGRYANLSPSARAFVTTFTPFAPWYVNSLYFVLVTMPKSHPVVSALLAGAYQASEPKREKLGLTQFPQKGGKKQPDFLQGSIPFKSGLGRYNYTPFSAWSDPLANAGQLVLPQYGFLNNLLGLSWKNQPLSDAHGNTPGILMRAGIALNTMAESFIPMARYVQQVREGGGSAYDTSTLVSPQVRKGTRGGAGKVASKLNPFRLVPGTPKGGKSTGSSATGIDWGSVDWKGAQGGGVDWSKVDWKAASGK